MPSDRKRDREPWLTDTYKGAGDVKPVISRSSKTPESPPPSPPAGGYPPGGFATKNHRIMQGETIGAVVWSNLAASIGFFARVVYDNGLTDDFVLGPFTTGSSRASQGIWAGNQTAGGNPAKTAKFNGWVTSFTGLSNVGTGPTQRGQTYAQALIITGEVNAQARDCLAADYVFTGNGLQLDRYIAPGPAGGRGQLTSFTGTDPAANVEANDAVPTGAIWSPRAYDIVLVSDANVANRDVGLAIDNGANTGRIYTFRSIWIQAASLTRTWSFSRGNAVSQTAQGTIATSFVDTQNVFNVDCLPADLFLPAGSRLRTVTANRQVTDNFGAPDIEIEEWVMPN